MTHKTVKFILLSLLILLTTTIFAQRKSISYTDGFPASKNVTVNLDIEYTTLEIVKSYSDSITIISEVSLMPTNVQHPFVGIIQKVQQSSNLDIHCVLKYEENIQVNNKLISSCVVKVPEGTQLNIKGKYSDVHIKTLTGKITSDFEYVTFNAENLNAATPHIFNANYSKIIVDSLENTLNINGTNLEIELKNIKEVNCKTKFSTFHINELEKLNSESYTDKFIITKADSIEIKSEYSSCSVNNLEQYFQGEMSYGTLLLKYISPRFTTINIASVYVNTQLNVDTASSFSVNADIRYCMLEHENIPLRRIVSPKGTLYSGEYGISSIGNISIISSFGDVNIHLLDN